MQMFDQSQSAWRFELGRLSIVESGTKKLEYVDTSDMSHYFECLGGVHLIVRPRGNGYNAVIVVNTIVEESTFHKHYDQAYDFLQSAKRDYMHRTSLMQHTHDRPHMQSLCS